MLHDNLNILVIWFMPNMLKMQGLGGRLEMLRGQDLLMEFIQRICLNYKTSLGFRRPFQVKLHQSSKTLVVIGCTTLCSRREEVLIHQPRSQLVKSVARRTMVIALKGQSIALVVVKSGTK